MTEVTVDLLSPPLEGKLELATNPFLYDCLYLFTYSPPEQIRRCTTALLSTPVSEYFDGVKSWFDLSKGFVMGKSSLNEAFTTMMFLPEGNSGKEVTLANVLYYIPAWYQAWPWFLILTIGVLFTGALLVYTLLLLFSKDFENRYAPKFRLNKWIYLGVNGYVNLMTFIFGTCAAAYMFQVADEKFNTKAISAFANVNGRIQFGEYGLIETGTKMVYLGNAWGATNERDYDIQQTFTTPKTCGPDPLFLSYEKDMDQVQEGYATTIEQELLRSSWDKKFDWSNLASQFGVRGYWNLVTHKNFVSTDEYKGRHSDYVGLPIACQDAENCAYVTTTDNKSTVKANSLSENDARSLKYLYGATNRHQAMAVSPKLSGTHTSMLCWHNVLNLAVDIHNFLLDVYFAVDSDICVDPEEIISTIISMSGIAVNEETLNEMDDLKMYIQEDEFDFEVDEDVLEKAVLQANSNIGVLGDILTSFFKMQNVDVEGNVPDRPNAIEPKAYKDGRIYGGTRAPLAPVLQMVGDVIYDLLYRANGLNDFVTDRSIFHQTSSFKHPTGLFPAMIDPHYQRTIYEDILGGGNYASKSPIFDILAREFKISDGGDDSFLMSTIIDDIKVNCSQFPAYGSYHYVTTDDGVDHKHHVFTSDKFKFCESTFGKDCGELASVVDFEGSNEDALAYSVKLFSINGDEAPMFGDLTLDGRELDDFYRQPYSDTIETLGLCDLVDYNQPKAKSGSDFTVDNFVQFFRGKPKRLSKGDVKAYSFYTPTEYPVSPDDDDDLEQHFYYKTSDDVCKTRTDNVSPMGPFISAAAVNETFSKEMLNAAKIKLDNEEPRFIEFYDFIEILANGTWDLNEVGMTLMQMLDWKVGESDVRKNQPESSSFEESKINGMIYALAAVFTTFFFFAIVGQIGFTYFEIANPVGGVMDTKFKRILYTASVVNYFGQMAFYFVLLIIGCVAVWLMVELASFVNMPYMSRMLLSPYVLPDLVNELAPHWQIPRCIFHGEEFYEVNYSYPEGHIEAYENLPDMMSEAANGLQIDSASFIPNFSGPLYTDAAKSKWSDYTVTLEDAMNSLKRAKDSANAILAERLEQAAVINVRGVYKGLGDENWSIGGDSPFDSLMSSAVHESLLLVSLADQGRSLEVQSTDALLVFNSHLESAKLQAVAGAEKERKVLIATTLGVNNRFSDRNAFVKSGQNIYSFTGTIDQHHPSYYDRESDFYLKLFGPLADFNADPLTPQEMTDLAAAYNSNADIIGGEALKSRVITNFDNAAKNLEETKTIKSWDMAAHDYLTSFYGGEEEIKKPIAERDFCNYDMPVDIPDICILALRIMPFVKPDGFDDMDAGKAKDELKTRKQFMLPVAGHCIYDPLPEDYHEAENYKTNNCINPHYNLDHSVNVGKKYACIQPMNTVRTGTYGSQVWDMVLGVSSGQEYQIYDNHSGLLPFDFRDNWGRDPRWRDPLYFLTSTPEGLALNEPSPASKFVHGLYAPALGLYHFDVDLPTAEDQRIMKTMSGSEDTLRAVHRAFALAPYRDCLMGREEQNFPVRNIYKQKQNGFSDGPIDLNRPESLEMIELMASLEQIQRWNSVSAFQTNTLTSNSAIAQVEHYYKGRDIESIPTLDDFNITNDDMWVRFNDALDRYKDGNRLLNEVANCPETTDYLITAGDALAAAGLGHASAIAWCIFFMAFGWFFYGGILLLQVLRRKEDLAKSEHTKSASSLSSSSYSDSSSSDHQKTTEEDVDISVKLVSKESSESILTVHSRSSNGESAAVVLQTKADESSTV